MAAIARVCRVDMFAMLSLSTGRRRCLGQLTLFTE
jgi:hypothetical protein